MKTDDLIRLLSEDRRPPVIISRRLPLALAAGGAVSFGLLLLTVGLRPDLGTAISGWRVLLKLGATVLLALLGALAALDAARPGRGVRSQLLFLLAPLCLVAAGGLYELVSAPSGSLPARWLGQNAAFCLFFIPVLSLAPLSALLATLRHGAPDSPHVAGAVAGLAAGCLAAALYALHCPDDSPLFVLTWYSLAIAVPTLVGSLAGRRVLAW